MRILLASLFLVVLASADDGMFCKQHLQALPKPVNPKPGRKYARDRLVDILHLKIDVVPDFKQRTLSVTTEWTFKPIARPLAEFTLDAMSLSIDSVEAKGATVASTQSTDEQLILTFGKPIAPDAEVTIIIKHRVQPENGIYFRTPEMGYKQGDTQMWTQGEAELHRYWFPCYDYPNERFTSEITCHVADGMEVVSNGHLVSKDQDAHGLIAWHWSQDKSHANYLLALAAGYFHKLEAKVGDLPIAMLVPPSEKDQAANAFLDTKDIIGFYNQEIGVPFAWDKYFQVYCHDFLAGGMENTSCTFEAASMLFQSDTEDLFSLHELDAHETAHQWFGDLVTSRDWSHLWLNEGFASYYTILYEEHKNGRDEMLQALWESAKRVLEQQDTKPVVWRDYQDPMEQFDYRVYPKGAWILHMIRSRIGPELYRKSIKTYLERHRGGVVSTDDLEAVLDEVTGLSWDQFFDQWLHHGGTPDLAINYSYDAATKLAKLNVKQQQKLSDQVRLFALDLPVRFFIKDKPIDFNAKLSKADEDFYFPLDTAPDLVRIDPDYTLLARINFTPPGDMLKRQLKSDVIGRLLAVQKLADKDDHESIGQLKTVLNTDAFWSVRAEAASALKKIANEESRTALATSLNQPSARVRKSVVEALAAFPHEEARAALWKQAGVEKNPAILAAIIQTWGARPGESEISAALRKHLSTPSFRERLASAAINALRAQDDATAVPSVMEALKTRLTDFRNRDHDNLFDSLAFLARNDKDRSLVRSFLASLLNDPRQGVRVAAVKALGTLRDPAAIALLTPLTQVQKPYQDPVREAAEKSLATLQTQLDGPMELKNVLQRLDTMQKESEKLQKELEALKKQTKPEKKK